ncbi:MAG TPA: FkbM family methyltransferase [Bryobacteraceae bacterium]|nr:FkbM family methyltransferase [Bryobacteraceae bacterium]
MLYSRAINSLRIAVLAPFVISNWVYFFVSRFQRRNGLLKFRNGLVFSIRPRSSDRASITEVNILRAYSQPAPGAIVLDVGANIGAFTLRAARTANLVYAIEPVQSNCEMLIQNCDLNRVSNVRPVRLAISGENGEAEMSTNGVTSSLHWREPGTAAEMVHTQTLERFLDANSIKHVDFLKMDCEGAEWDILRDMRVFSRISHVEMEYHVFNRSQIPSELADRLRAAGFNTRVRGNSSSGIIVATKPASA